MSFTVGRAVLNVVDSDLGDELDTDLGDTFRVKLANDVTYKR